MVEQQKSIVTKYTGVKELETLNSGQKHSYHIFIPVESGNDIKEIKIRYDNPGITDLVLKLQGKYELNWNENESQPKRIFNKEDNIAIVTQEEDNGNNNNDKKVKDCPTCLEKINYALAKCEDWETKRKKQLEDLKKEKCFHEKNIDNTPLLLRTSGYSKTKDKCTKCQREYVSSKSNKEGDKKTFSHNCSQEPDNQRDEEDDNDNSNNNKIAEKSTVRKYCKDNDIKRLEYDEGTGKLIIIYNKSDKPKSELDNLNEELQEIKNYLKKNGQKDNKNKKYFLTDRDWEERQTQANPSNKTNWTPWIIAGGIGLFIIVLIAVIGLVRKSD